MLQVGILYFLDSELVDWNNLIGKTCLEFLECLKFLLGANLAYLEDYLVTPYTCHTRILWQLFLSSSRCYDRKVYTAGSVLCLYSVQALVLWRAHDVKQKFSLWDKTSYKN